MADCLRLIDVNARGFLLKKGQGILHPNIVLQGAGQRGGGNLLQFLRFFGPFFHAARWAFSPLRLAPKWRQPPEARLDLWFFLALPNQEGYAITFLEKVCWEGSWESLAEHVHREFTEEFLGGILRSNLNSVHTRCIVKTSGFTRGVCKNRGFH